MPGNTIVRADRTLWSPDVHSNYAIEARYDARFMETRVLNQSEDALRKGQKVVIHDLTPKLLTHAVGDNGSVKPQKIPAATKEILITEFRETSFDIRVDVPLNSLENEQKMGAKAAGEAHQEYIERFLLALETGILSGNRIDSAGTNIADTDILAAKTKLDLKNVPATGRHMLLSTNQANLLLTNDWARRVDFSGLGKGQAPILTGELFMALFGFEPLMGNLNVRRSLGAGPVDRTVQLFWHKEAFAIAIQKKIGVRGPLAIDLADRFIYWTLFGATTTRPDHAAAVQTPGT